MAHRFLLVPRPRGFGRGLGRLSCLSLLRLFALGRLGLGAGGQRWQLDLHRVGQLLAGLACQLRVVCLFVWLTVISTLSNGPRRLISPSACAGVEIWRAKRRATATQEPLERTRQRQERDAVLSGSLLPFGNAGDQRSLPRKGRRIRLFRRCRGRTTGTRSYARTSAGSRGSQATPSALRRKLFFGICTNRGLSRRLRESANERGAASAAATVNA